MVLTVGREGVVVRFDDGEVVKVKSWWWFRSGFTGKRRQGAVEWVVQERAFLTFLSYF